MPKTTNDLKPNDYEAILPCDSRLRSVCRDSCGVSCTKDATGGGGGGYDGEPEVNHDMDGILRRNYLWNEEYATLSPDFGLPYDEFLGDVLMRMKTNDLDKKFRNEGGSSIPTSSASLR